MKISKSNQTSSLIYKNKKIESLNYTLSRFNIDFHKKLYIFRIKSIKTYINNRNKLENNTKNDNSNIKIIFLFVLFFAFLRIFLTLYLFLYKNNHYINTSYDDINIKQNKKISQFEYENKACLFENLIKVYININDE